MNKLSYHNDRLKNLKKGEKYIQLNPIPKKPVNAYFKLYITNILIKVEKLKGKVDTKIFDDFEVERDVVQLFNLISKNAKKSYQQIVS